MTQSDLQTYEKTVRIEPYQCDLNGNMKAGELLRLVQQVSVDQCETLGMDQAFFDRYHMAFLLAKVSLVFNQPIAARQDIRFVTQPFAPQRAVYFRYTRLYDQAGQELASVDSRWMLVDTQTRRILRSLPEGIEPPFTQQACQSHSCTLPRDVETTPAGVVQASYSRCDTYQHMNNSLYAEIACDLLPPPLMRERPIQRMVIFYHKEIGFTQTAQLAVGQIQGGYYVRGITENQPCFEAGIWF